MRIPYAPPRPPYVLLRELQSLKQEIEESVAQDPVFRHFFYTPTRWPFRMLGLTGTSMPISLILKAWENRNG